MDQEKQKKIYTGNKQAKYLIVQTFKTAFKCFSDHEPIIIRPSISEEEKTHEINCYNFVLHIC
jgi:hypothetical protein